jgi:hypothetical protein
VSAAAAAAAGGAGCCCCWLLLPQDLPLLDGAYFNNPNGNQLDGALYDLSGYAGKDFQVGLLLLLLLL